MTADVPTPEQPPESPILFFDGVCGLCNYSVNWLLARDRHHRLRFSPLQGATAERLVPLEIRRGLSTVVLVHCGRVFVRSTAISRTLMQLTGPCWLLGWLLWLIPWPLRDVGYRMVARIRYRLFGRHDVCRMPTPEERAVFLP